MSKLRPLGDSLTLNAIFILFGCGPSPQHPTAPSKSTPSTPSSDSTPDGSAFVECMDQSTAMPLVLHGYSPYTDIKIAREHAEFLIDFGATFSTIDPSHGAFGDATHSPTGGDCPNKSPCHTGVEGSLCAYADFVFFGGGWAPVCLSQTDHSGIKYTNAVNFHQGGVIGTDFLASTGYLIDYTNLKFLRGTKPCSDDKLKQYGFLPMSAKGFYSASTSAGLNPMQSVLATAPVGELVPNVPTVRISIGATKLATQLDSGYDDSIISHSLNINRAAYDSLVKAGIRLRLVNVAVKTLSSCHGVDIVTAYSMAGSSVSLVAETGEKISEYNDVMLLLKTPTKDSLDCKGIATWTIPAAQMGNSFLVQAGTVYYDPAAGRVWLPGRRDVHAL